MKHIATVKPALLPAALAILSAHLLVGVASSRAASPRAEHTVTWYAAHPTARQNVLQQCDDDRSLDSNGDCRNATAAAAQTSTDGSVNGHDAFVANNTVAAYKANGPLRGMVLAACTTNRPPPAVWCRAAQEAEQELHR